MEMQLDVAKVKEDQETLAHRQGRILANQQDLSNSVKHALEKEGISAMQMSDNEKRRGDFTKFSRLS